MEAAVDQIVFISNVLRHQTVMKVFFILTEGNGGNCKDVRFLCVCVWARGSGKQWTGREGSSKSEDEVPRPPTAALFTRESIWCERLMWTTDKRNQTKKNSGQIRRDGEETDREINETHRFLTTNVEVWRKVTGQQICQRKEDFRNTKNQIFTMDKIYIYK